MSSFLCCICVVFRDGHYSSVYHGAGAHMFFTCHRVMGGVRVLLSNKTTSFLGSTKTTGALEAQKQLLSGTGFCLLGWISVGKVAIRRHSSPQHTLLSFICSLSKHPLYRVPCVRGEAFKDGCLAVPLYLPWAPQLHRSALGFC